MHILLDKAIPNLKDCDTNDKAKADALASHFKDVLKEKIADVKDLEDDSQVTPILMNMLGISHLALQKL
jgi:hypothetical protein